jgi:hypothetical protein
LFNFALRLTNIPLPNEFSSNTTSPNISNKSPRRSTKSPHSTVNIAVFWVITRQLATHSGISRVTGKFTGIMRLANDS